MGIGFSFREMRWPLVVFSKVENVLCELNDEIMLQKCRLESVHGFAECHYAECHYSEYRYTVCHYAEYHYAECHYAECNYAVRRYAECHYAVRRYTECPGACPRT